ncbi:kinase-like domain-containing protein [Triangularia verruculosa]|uniref:Kinase-like domain-containing protein n=1 Tax=Triangularia verruculosa TaxID=2587418 RepID=A0AAN7ATD2_9PEZI|nr:kinase-like domain-containing protein [Triangularia verruculosa]
MGVQHPSIIELMEIFQDTSSTTYVLELAPEGEFFDLIVRKEKLSEQESRHVFQQLFAAVSYLHQRNIVHRDIKPESILVFNKNLHVKLGGFGLATHLPSHQYLTDLCGTPSYVAPEILAESPSRQYGKAVDIWSLGVVLYICLCGFPPFSDEHTGGDFPYKLNEQIQQGRFGYPSSYWDSIGAPALDLIDSMLEVMPTDRFSIEQCLSHPWLTNSSRASPPPSRPQTPTVSDQFSLQRHHNQSQKTEAQVGDVMNSDNEDTKKPAASKAADTMSYARQPMKVEGKTPTLDAYKGDMKREADSTLAEMVEHLSLQQLPVALSEDFELHYKDPGNRCWTCTPPETIGDNPAEIPLMVDEVPVVIPVRFHYPLLPLRSQPPDPHPTLISPIKPLSDDTIGKILSVFQDAIGFYLLINDQLQVIVSDEFDYEEELHKHPAFFGGLKVSFIRKSLYPTADRSGPTSTHRMEGSSTATTDQQMPTTAQSVNTNAAALPATLWFRVYLGSTIQVSSSDSKSKERIQGRIGVLVAPKSDPRKRYITVSTHTLAMAAATSKTAKTEPDWTSNIQITSVRKGWLLGKVDKVFDPSPQETFPFGFSHDVSFVDVTKWRGAVQTRLLSQSLSFQWLSLHEWTAIKYNSSKLALLDDDLIEDEAKSIGVIDSRYQMVGQGIFRVQQQSRPRRSFRSMLSRAPADPRDDPAIWTSLVARSILYRVRQPSNFKGLGQSGTPVCVVENLPNTAGKISKVAGFSSFVQMSSDNQRFDLEGELLYKRLEEGRVAFYGAFQVPAELRGGYRIV